MSRGNPDASTARLVGWIRRRPEFLVAAVLFVVLVATSAGYGWHRDELYFAVAGRHPDWGYPDQPLLTPLVTAALDFVGSGSLVVVRLASAVASAATALLTGAVAGRLGGAPRARLIASATWAVGGVSLVTGHFVDTTTFDILATVAVCYCIIRAIADHSDRCILAAGAVLALGLLNKMLIGLVIALVCASFLAVGPRALLFTRRSCAAGCLALLGAAPYLLWQALHGWPQFALARSIAANGAEGGRIGVIPFQLILVSPFLVPVWIAGVVFLLRNRGAVRARGFAVAYLALLVVVILTGGKAYYAAGLLPIMVAAGGVATDAWLTRARTRARRTWRTGFLTGAIAIALAVNATLGLAILPIDLLTPTRVEEINPDAGEQVAWPAFTATVARAFDTIPPPRRSDAVILTDNYGEAGAVDRYGGALGLPQAYSGHNGFALWGPPHGTGEVILVGFDTGAALHGLFVGCQVVAKVDNGFHLQNDEQGTIVQRCARPAAPWATLWPGLIHFD